MIRIRCVPVLALIAASGLAACRVPDLPPLPPAPSIDETEGAIADLSLRVRRLAGPTLTECGEFLKAGRAVPDEELGRAVGCGLEASAQKQPFWLVLPGHLFHRFDAEGLFAGKDGMLYHFNYQGDLPIWRGPEPIFNTTPCPRPTAFRNPNGLAAFQCIGDP
jgi:hypothetical protein